MNPPLKNLVRPAIEHAVRELIQPVAERVIKVAMTTTEHVVKKVRPLAPLVSRCFLYLTGRFGDRILHWSLTRAGCESLLII